MPSLVGNKPNQVPTNGDLGTLAFEDHDNVNITGGAVSNVSNAGNLTFTGTGNRITGDFSNGTVANRVMFQSSTANGATAISAIPNGTGVASQFFTYSNSDPTNASVGIFSNNNSTVNIQSSITGTGNFLPLAMFTGGSERLRIDTSGNVGIGLTPTARNNTRLQIVDGIGFPATQVASSDANTLDDYEEGTWTPTSGGGTGGTAQYTKIGRMVYIYGDVSFTGVSSASSSVAGLPFVPAHQSAIAITYQSVSGSAIGAIAVAGTSRIDIYNLVETLVNIANTKRIIFFGAYAI